MIDQGLRLAHFLLIHVFIHQYLSSLSPFSLNVEGLSSVSQSCYNKNILS